MRAPVDYLDVYVLDNRYANGTGGWEEIFDYGGTVYHVRLSPSRDGKGIQDSLLKKLGNAIDMDEEDEVTEYADECRALIFPLVEAHYSSRCDVEPGLIVKLQGETVDGTLRPVQHQSTLEISVTNSVTNTFDGVRTFAKEAILRVKELTNDIFKVEIDGHFFCMKTVHRSGNQRDFIREVSILRHCSHPNIIKLTGLVLDSNNDVEAMLLEYVPTAKSLREIDGITQLEFETWQRQIENALEYLHSEGLVWGDAKPDNILVRDNRDVVLIDFGGGRTSRWVSSDDYETFRGDAEAGRKIVEYMRGKLVSQDIGLIAE
jgi:serine/threonine protein kinase